MKDKGVEYRKGKFPFFASGRARAADDIDGFVKIPADVQYGEILGVHIIGARSADLIQQAAIAMQFEITDVELGKMTYPTSHLFRGLEGCLSGIMRLWRDKHLNIKISF